MNDSVLINATMEPEYTRLLNASTVSRDGELFAGLYAELKKIAAGRMAMERQDQTLNVTALVHEAWLRLQQSAPEKWRDRKQFFAASAEAMRRILVEAARKRLAAKRGGGEARLDLDGLNLPAPVADERLLEIHEVLDRLEAEDELKARIVKLRFFSGMGHDETAALLEINEKTVRRHLATQAGAWLHAADTLQRLGEIDLPGSIDGKSRVDVMNMPSDVRNRMPDDG